MLMRLSKNTFVRQFGPFTYVIGRINAFDQMFRDAEPFFRWLTREPIEKDELLKRICSVYTDADEQEIGTDFDALMKPLVDDKIVLCAESVAELDASDESFSYDVEHPKTMDTRVAITSKEAFATLPQKVLGDWFLEHPTVFTLQIDVTQACTERCVHCYIPEYNPIYLTFENIKKAIDELREMGGLTLSLSGGECMMHPDFDKVVRYAREKDLIVGVLSNLTLCDDEKVELLREAEATVQVSLYSMNPDVHDAITHRKGSWLKTKVAIEKIRAAHIPCRISCPTMKANYKDYLGVLDYARSLKMDAQTDFIIMGKMNCDTTNLACRLDLEETRHLLEDIVFRSVPMKSEYFSPGKKEKMRSDAEFMADKICGACVDSVCLDATGNYYPCPAFAGVTLGNCYKHSLKWVWNESPETLRLRNVRGRDFPKCAKCDDRDYCSICMCRNFNETGNIFNPAEHFCNVAKLNHEVVDERFRRMDAKP